MKIAGGIHLKSTEKNFLLQMTELEQEWTTAIITECPHINPKLSHKLMNKLLAHNIYKIKHITLLNGTNIMSHEDFKTYYHNPTMLEKNALNIAEQLFCHPKCT